MVPAVILAGGPARGAPGADGRPAHRALTPVNGRPMLCWVLDALAGAGSVSGVTVVGQAPAEAACARVPDQGGFVDNLFAGLQAAGPGEVVAVATCDIPFLTPEAVDDLVRRGLALGADIVYPIVAVERCQARFPGVPRTSLRLREGRFTGGNVTLLRRGFVDAQRGRIEAAYAARKSPGRLAAMLGAGVTLRLAATLALRRPLLGLADLEVAISRQVGGRARALISDYAELATDLDRPADIAAMRERESGAPG